MLHMFSAQSRTVITVNQGVRAGKVTELKRTVDAAVKDCPSVQQVLVAMRTENPVTMTAKDMDMEEVREQKANQELIEILMPTLCHFLLDSEKEKEM